MILTTTQPIAKKIREVLAPGNGRRVVIVAFVGRDALQFIGGKAAAKGLELYCWDNPTSTSPIGIRELFKEGARIYFVDDLHMKVFWSERGGFVLGSPNLSRAALDGDSSRNLLEIATYCSTSDRLPLEDILKQIRHRIAREVKGHEDIDRFADRCAIQRKSLRVDSGNKGMTKSPTFDAYLREGGPAFSFIAYDDRGPIIRADREAAAKARRKAFGAHEEPSDSFIRDCIIASKGKHHKKWILAFRSSAPTKTAEFAWIYTHAEAPAGKHQKTKIQVKGIEVPEAAPFDLKTSNFKKRFTAYLRERYSDVLDAEGSFNVAAFQRFEAAQ